MSSSELLSRRVVLGGLAASLVALSGCVGYEPVNAPGGSSAGLRSGEIAVQAPQAEDEFALVERLEQRLGRSGRARYSLGYTLSVDEDPVGVRPNQETQRYNVIGRIDWTLTDSAAGIVVNSGGFESFTSYAATGQAVSGQTAQQDAHTRLMVLLADQLVTKLSATAAEWRAASQ